MKEEKNDEVKNDNFVNNSFHNENLKVLEDKEDEFEVNLGILNDNPEEEYSYQNEEDKKDDNTENSNKIDEDNDAPAIGENNKAKLAIKPRKYFDLSIIFLMLSIISLIGLFFGESLRNIGLLLSVLALFGSMLFLDKRHRFSEIAFSISIIIVIIYIIIYVLTFTKIDTSVNGEKAKLFREKAAEILQTVKSDIINNEMVKCDGRGQNQIRMVLPIDKEVSPFGNEYNKDMSYVLIESLIIDGKCSHSFAIYLTDGIYSLGTIVEPVKEERVLRTEIRKVVREQN